MLLVAALAGCSWVGPPGPTPSPAGEAQPTGEVTVLLSADGPNKIVLGDRTFDVPAPVGPATRRLPAVPVTTQGAHAFTYTDDATGAPIGYDPCRPVTYVIRAAGLPSWGEETVTEAVAYVSGASGLQFVYQGFTDEPGEWARPIIQPERYGLGWAPALIMFTSQEEHPELAQVSGLTRTYALPGERGTGHWLGAGMIALNLTALERLRDGGDGPAAVRTVIMHEVGHLVGLAHVEDPAEVMYPETGRTTSWGPGDLQGLAMIGQGPCEPS